MEYTLVIKNKTEEIAKCSDFVEISCEALGVSMKWMLKLQLVLEEAVSNVISYAYSNNTVEDILIRISKKGNALVVVVEDTGKPFDPTSKGDVDVTLPLEMRKVGGLGIFLMKKIMDEVDYKRIENRNILMMKKEIN